MQQKTTFFGILSLVFLVCVLSTSCSKTGQAGATGATGPQGNANVIVDTLTLTSAQWLWNDDYALYTSNGSYTEWFTRYHTVSFAPVTQGVLDSGVVLVYFTPFMANGWLPLPYSFDTGNGFAYDFVYVTSPGKVELEFFFDTYSPTATPPALSTFNMATYQFKIVAVTGTLTASQRSQLQTANDYQTAAKILGL